MTFGDRRSRHFPSYLDSSVSLGKLTLFVDCLEYLSDLRDLRTEIACLLEIKQQ